MMSNRAQPQVDERKSKRQKVSPSVPKPPPLPPPSPSLQPNRQLRSTRYKVFLQEGVCQLCKDQPGCKACHYCTKCRLSLDARVCYPCAIQLNRFVAEPIAEPIAMPIAMPITESIVEPIATPIAVHAAVPVVPDSNDEIDINTLENLLNQPPKAKRRANRQYGPIDDNSIHGNPAPEYSIVKELQIHAENVALSCAEKEASAIPLSEFIKKSEEILPKATIAFARNVLMPERWFLSTYSAVNLNNNTEFTKRLALESGVKVELNRQDIVEMLTSDDEKDSENTESESESESVVEVRVKRRKVKKPVQANKKTVRKRGWCFTINNPNLESLHHILYGVTSPDSHFAFLAEKYNVNVEIIHVDEQKNEKNIQVLERLLEIIDEKRHLNALVDNGNAQKPSVSGKNGIEIPYKYTKLKIFKNEKLESPVTLRVVITPERLYSIRRFCTREAKPDDPSKYVAGFEHIGRVVKSSKPTDGNIIDPTWTKTPHFQGYVCYKNARTFTGVLKILQPKPTMSRCHVEIQKGSSKDNSDYCKKETVLCVEGSFCLDDNDAYELAKKKIDISVNVKNGLVGSMAGRPRKTRQERVTEALIEVAEDVVDRTNSKLALETHLLEGKYSTTILNNRSKFNQLTDAVKAKRMRIQKTVLKLESSAATADQSTITRKKHFFVYGDSGLGKTRHILAAVGDDDQLIYRKTLTNWWCGYANQPYVLIDDVTPTFCQEFSAGIKSWTSGIVFAGQVKGTMSIRIEPDFVIVMTSNYSLQSCFPDIEDRVPLLDRFNVVCLENLPVQDVANTEEIEVSKKVVDINPRLFNPAPQYALKEEPNEDLEEYVITHSNQFSCTDKITSNKATSVYLTSVRQLYEASLESLRWFSQSKGRQASIDEIPELKKKCNDNIKLRCGPDFDLNVTEADKLLMPDNESKDGVVFTTNILDASKRIHVIYENADIRIFNHQPNYMVDNPIQHNLNNLLKTAHKNNDVIHRVTLLHLPPGYHRGFVERADMLYRMVGKQSPKFSPTQKNDPDFLSRAGVLWRVDKEGLKALPPDIGDGLIDVTKALDDFISNIKVGNPIIINNINNTNNISNVNIGNVNNEKKEPNLLNDNIKQNKRIISEPVDDEVDNNVI